MIRNKIFFSAFVYLTKRKSENVIFYNWLATLTRESQNSFYYFKLFRTANK